MKAAVLHAPNQPLTIEDVSLEKPKNREVLLRTAFAGLCHSDLHFIEGLYPHPTGWSRRSATGLPMSSRATT
jgi:S-(hydroxymethyl)glutathione dehydrogenase/alcohol dehydrogenase